MRVQMSMVNKVLLLLKMEAKELMRAASMTASINPLSPEEKWGIRKIYDKINSTEGYDTERHHLEHQLSTLLWFLY